MAKKKGKPPKGYDSWFEYELHQGVLKDCKYHTGTVSYTQEKLYEPDFEVGDFLIEAKGRFRDSEEARKYVDIRRSIVFQELVFVFYHPDTPMPRARRRKDGTKFTMANGLTRMVLGTTLSRPLLTFLRKRKYANIYRRV